METTETNAGAGFAPIPEPSQITLGFEAQSYLREAGKWSSFLGIIGFIFCGLIVIAAFSFGAIISMISKYSPDPTASVALAGMTGFITVFYLLIGLVYFFFSLYLYQFGSRVKKGIQFSDSLHVTDALGKLKSFFKLWGILTIVIIALYILVFVAFIVIGMSAASMGR